MLVAEVKFTSRNLTTVAETVARRRPPELPSRYRRHRLVRALSVPDAPRIASIGEVAVVTLRDLVGGRPGGAKTP